MNPDRKREQVDRIRREGQELIQSEEERLKAARAKHAKESGGVESRAKEGVAAEESATEASKEHAKEWRSGEKSRKEAIEKDRAEKIAAEKEAAAKKKKQEAFDKKKAEYMSSLHDAARKKLQEDRRETEAKTEKRMRLQTLDSTSSEKKHAAQKDEQRSKDNVERRTSQLLEELKRSTDVKRTEIFSEDSRRRAAVASEFHRAEGEANGLRSPEKEQKLREAKQLEERDLGLLQQKTAKKNTELEAAYRNEKRAIEQRAIKEKIDAETEGRRKIATLDLERKVEKNRISMERDMSGERS